MSGVASKELLKKYLKHKVEHNFFWHYVHLDFPAAHWGWWTSRERILDSWESIGTHVNAARLPGVETGTAFLTPSPLYLIFDAFSGFPLHAPAHLIHPLVSCVCFREENSSQGGESCDAIIRRQGSPTVKPGGPELCRIGRLP